MMGGGGRALNPSVVLEEIAKEEPGIKSVEIFDVRKDGRKLIL